MAALFLIVIGGFLLFYVVAYIVSIVMAIRMYSQIERENE